MRVLFKSILSMLAAICGLSALGLLAFTGIKLMPVFMGSDASIQPLTIQYGMGGVFLLFSAIGLWSWGRSIGVLVSSRRTSSGSSGNGGGGGGGGGESHSHDTGSSGDGGGSSSD